MIIRVLDPHPFHADLDLDPGFEIFADWDTDSGFEIFLDLDLGLVFSKKNFYVKKYFFKLWIRIIMQIRIQGL
jgi:hypothetical protein